MPDSHQRHQCGLSRRQSAGISTSLNDKCNNKKLGRCWDSATCELLDEILRSRVPNAISGTSGSRGHRRWYHSICQMRFPISVYSKVEERKNKRLTTNRMHPLCCTSNMRNTLCAYWPLSVPQTTVKIHSHRHTSHGHAGFRTVQKEYWGEQTTVRKIWGMVARFWVASERVKIYE